MMPQFCTQKPRPRAAHVSPPRTSEKCGVGISYQPTRSRWLDIEYQCTHQVRRERQSQRKHTSSGGVIPKTNLFPKEESLYSFLIEIQNIQSNSFVGKNHVDAWGVSQEKKKLFYMNKNT